MCEREERSLSGTGFSSCMTHPASDCLGWQSVTSRQPFWTCWTMHRTGMSIWLQIFYATTELVIFRENMVVPCFKGPGWRHLRFQFFWLFRPLLRCNLGGAVLGITWALSRGVSEAAWKRTQMQTTRQTGTDRDSGVQVFGFRFWRLENKCTKQYWQSGNLLGDTDWSDWRTWESGDHD